MKKLFFAILTISVITVTSLSACSRSDGGENGGGDTGGGTDTGTTTAVSVDETPFFPSEGMTEDGFWEGIRALDYIEMFDYASIVIPPEVHTVSEEAIAEQISNLLVNYPERIEITDRAVEDGDVVNIDYVGSIDGVEFDGGNSNGQGADVTAGSAQFIDDFLTQIIGHMPGETFDVHVSFPEVYDQNPDLAGKPALFVTTINYITEEREAVFDDSFVARNFADTNDLYTTEDVRNFFIDSMRDNAMQNFIFEYLTTNVTIKSIPQQLLDYQIRSLTSYYNDAAGYYGVTLEELLSGQLGLDSLDALIAAEDENIRSQAVYSLVLQAVAESAGITVTEEDMTEYFTEYQGSPDYSMFLADYGIANLRQVVLQFKTASYIIDNAVLG